jgi:hypothetical protein
VGAEHDRAPSFADVVEGVRNTMAAYTQALDDGRTADVVATFCPDGLCDMPGLGRHQGRQALHQAYDAVTPRQPQRHLVVNTHVVAWTGDEVQATSDVVLLFKGERGWAVGVVGRYDDLLHRSGETWLFHSRVAEFV